MTDPAQGNADLSGTVAVLCAGPSLGETWGRFKGKYSLKATIAVNLALKFHLADWWMCMDPMGFGLVGHWPVLGCCGWTSLIDSKDHYELLNGKPSPSQDMKRDHCVEFIRDWYGGKGSAANWSSTAAFCYAVARLKAKRLVIFGNDLSGDTHCDGSRLQPGDLENDRFARERAEQNYVKQWLSDIGVLINEERPEHNAG